MGFGTMDIIILSFEIVIYFHSSLLVNFPEYDTLRDQDAKLIYTRFEDDLKKEEENIKYASSK